MKRLLLAACLFASPAVAQPRDAFDWLGTLNEASTVMVTERGIVSPALGASIARAVAQVIADGARARRAPPGGLPASTSRCWSPSPGRT